MDIEIVNTNSALPLNINKSNSDQILKTPIEFSATANDNDSGIQPNEAAALLQMVVAKLSGVVIRQIPASEYAHLLSIIDDIISGSVNKQI